MTLRAGIKTSRPDGFTLVELLLVIALMATLIGLSAPRLKGAFEELQLKNTAFSIYKLVHFAQEKAVVDKKRCKIVMDYERGRYRLLEWHEPPGDGTGAAPETAAFERAEGRAGREMRLPQRVSFEGDREEFICLPDGNCQEGRVRVFTGSAGYVISIGAIGSVKINDASR